MANPAIVTTFSPGQLIECYLRPKIAGELHHYAATSIVDADVYSMPPYELVAQHAPPPVSSSGTGDGDHGAPAPAWYFFCQPGYATSASSSRRSRTVAGTDGKRRWRTEAGRKGVEGSAGGYISKFSYSDENTSSGKWLMVEYGIDGYDTVIAKIYRSPRRPVSWSAPLSSSTASTWSRQLQEMENFLMSDD